MILEEKSKDLSERSISMDYKHICGKSSVLFRWLYRITLISALISALIGLLEVLRLVNWTTATVSVYAAILCVLPGILYGIVLILLLPFERGYLIAGITTLLGAVLSVVAVVISIADSFNTGIFYCVAAILVSLISTHFELKSHAGAMEEIHEDMHKAWQKMFIWFYAILVFTLLEFLAAFGFSPTVVEIAFWLLLVFSLVFYIKKILYLKRTSEILDLEAKG